MTAANIHEHTQELEGVADELVAARKSVKEAQRAQHEAEATAQQAQHAQHGMVSAADLDAAVAGAAAEGQARMSQLEEGVSQLQGELSQAQDRASQLQEQLAAAQQRASQLEAAAVTAATAGVTASRGVPQEESEDVSATPTAPATPARKTPAASEAGDAAPGSSGGDADALKAEVARLTKVGAWGSLL